MRSLNGETVRLSRGIHKTYSVTASPVLRPAEEIIPGIAITRVEYQEWGIDVSEYRIAGLEVVPEVNDVITRQDGSEYRVLSQDANTPPYRYVTNSRTRYLVNTELVKLGQGQP